MVEKAPQAHISAIKDFADLLRPSPGTAMPEELCDYQLHMTDTGVMPFSLTQRKVMSAIEACRTEVLCWQVSGCATCGHHHIACNSCKNRRCPKCKEPAARDWLAARRGSAPVGYFHVVFTPPAEIARIAFWNRKAAYDLLFRASVETVLTIAADPKRLVARVGMTAVLHT